MAFQIEIDQGIRHSSTPLGHVKRPDRQSGEPFHCGNEITHVKVGVAQVDLVPLFFAHLAKDRMLGAIWLSLEPRHGGAKLSQVHASVEVSGGSTTFANAEGSLIPDGIGPARSFFFSSPPITRMYHGKAFGNPSIEPLNAIARCR